jgi:diphthamide synthase (EF-2-diphthine--ammonia ligase)
VGLLTTISEAADRVAMHAVRTELLRRQAEAVGLPLLLVPIPSPCPNEVYEARMARALEQARREGIEAIAFGDLFLEDIRAYREQKLAGTGIRPLFPLWGLDTANLGRAMVRGGARAVVTCIDPRVCPVGVLGANYDDALLDALPPEVDPCAERGEFHTFAWDGPAFSHPVTFRRGEQVERDGFWFADVLPA